MSLQPAPTTNVFPGGFSKLKISSLVIPYSTAPGILGYLGLPPTAIRKYFAVKVLSPFLSTVWTVFASLKTPKPLIYSTFLRGTNGEK